MLNAIKKVTSVLNQTVATMDKTYVEIYGGTEDSLDLINNSIRLSSVEALIFGKKKEKMIALASLGLSFKGQYTIPILLNSANTIFRYKRRGIKGGVTYDVVTAAGFGVFHEFKKYNSLEPSEIAKQPEINTGMNEFGWGDDA